MQYMHMEKERHHIVWSYSVSLVVVWLEWSTLGNTEILSLVWRQLSEVGIK